MGKLCCCVAASEREEVFSNAAESPQPVAVAAQRSCSSPRLYESSSFGSDQTASQAGSSGARSSRSSLRYTPQHGIERSSSARNRTKLRVAIAVVTASNRLARGKMTDDKVDRRHSIWVLAEGARLAEDSAARAQHLECVASRQSSRELSVSGGLQETSSQELWPTEVSFSCSISRSPDRTSRSGDREASGRDRDLGPRSSR